MYKRQASSNLLSEMNVNGDIDLSVLSDTIDEMTDASDQLVDCLLYTSRCV